MKLEQALNVLPDLQALEPLRDALIGLSHPDASKLWSGSQAYLTLETRVVEPARLEGSLTELVERVRERTERLYRHVAAALRAVEQRDWAGAARELVAVGELEESAGHWAEAEQYLLKALELGRKPRDRSAEALALRRLGRVARARGQVERALRWYRAALEVAEALGDAEGVVVACEGLGNVHVDQRRWAEARAWYLRAMERVEEVDSYHFLHLCNSLSVVERRLGNPGESEAWLARGEARAGSGKSEALGYLEHGRARLHLVRGEWREAELVFRRALERDLDPAARVSALLNLAEPVMEQGRVEEAEGLIRTAEELAIRHHVIRYLPYAYRALGELARRRGDRDGFLFFEQALTVIHEWGLPMAEEAAALLDYARYEMAVGEPVSAVARLRAAQERFRAAGAEVEATEVARELARLEEQDPASGGAPD